MISAKNVRLDKLYELVADLESFQLQVFFLFHRCCKCCFSRPRNYKKTNLRKKWEWWRSFKKEILETCAREVEDDDSSDASDDNENGANSAHMLQEIKTTIQKLHRPPEVGPTRKTEWKKAVTGTNRKTLKSKPRP